MPIELKVRFRVDFGPQCSLGIGKVELLEGIGRCGSLSQAARDMRMSYRRAWLLLADLNSSFDQPVARMSTGGRGGGGAALTPFGIRLVAGYRKLESALQPLATSCLTDVGRRVSTQRTARLINPASVRRKQRTHQSR
jgi:molybdate transport system regulatory protein